jgi:phosphoserine phosphatase RsbU/P
MAASELTQKNDEDEPVQGLSNVHARTRVTPAMDREDQTADSITTRAVEVDDSATLRAEFLSMLAHDLRGPLSSIAMNAGLLSNAALQERQAKSVARISRSADRMNRMVRDLLDYMRASSGSGLDVALQPGSLADLCKQVIEESENANPGRKIRLDAISRGVGEWDADRMAQALGNVIGNALQYSPSDSEVSVTVTEEHDTVAVEVANDGDTVPPEVLSAAFDAYLRVRARSAVASRQGLGLGLYLTDQIVRAHGGRCELRSLPGDRTRLRIVLPVRDAGTPLVPT